METNKQNQEYSADFEELVNPQNNAEALTKSITHSVTRMIEEEGVKYTGKLLSRLLLSLAISENSERIEFLHEHLGEVSVKAKSATCSQWH